MKIIVLNSLVVFGLFSCSHPNAKYINNSELITNKDSLEFVKINPPSKMERSDDILDYMDHNAVIDARYSQNIDDLEEMQKNFSSEINAVQMKYDQSLYDLKKLNLKIKTKVNDHVIQDTKSWDDFKISSNIEMDSLEKSIRVLAE